MENLAVVGVVEMKNTIEQKINAMQELIFKAEVDENGKLSKVYQKTLFDETLKHYAGKTIRIRIAKWTKPRSLPQNRYYFGVLLAQVIDALVDNGIDRADLNTEVVHDMLKMKFLKKELVSEHGEVIEIVQSTSKLTTEEFSIYIDEIVRWCAETLSYVVYLPNEQAMLNFD